MFSRIRNHEKLVENGENPAIVAKRSKEGTHEKDSDPNRVLGKKGPGKKSLKMEVSGGEESDEKIEMIDGDVEQGGKEGKEDGRKVDCKYVNVEGKIYLIMKSGVGLERIYMSTRRV